MGNVKASEGGTEGFYRMCGLSPTIPALKKQALLSEGKTMKTSETINELAGALAKAQLAMKNATADADNPYFKSKYADLATVRDAVTPALAANGIAVVQLTSSENGHLIVHTRLMHSSGQWIESQYPIMNDTAKPQAMGSALTYARRYSLSAICGIASEKDDDGNAADDHGKTLGANGGTAGASKAQNRGEYTRLSAGIREIAKTGGLDDLNAYILANKTAINALPLDWFTHLKKEKEEAEAELTGKAKAA